MNNKRTFSEVFRSVCLHPLIFAALLLFAAPDAVRASHTHQEFDWNSIPVHALFENHGAPMLLIDPETGVILHGNRAARDFYGYPELCGMNIDRINILSPEEIAREMRRALALNENRFHFRHRLADASVRDVDVYSYAVPVEGRDLLYSVVIDRTEEVFALRALNERNLWIAGLLLAGLLAQSAVLLPLWRAVKRRRRAEAALEKQLAFIRSLIDIIPNPVFYKDAEGRYLGCNKAFRRLKGRSEEEILGKTAHDIEKKEIADEYLRTDREVLASLETWSYERQAVDKTAMENRTVIFNKAPFFDEKGEVAGIVGVITDITERKRIEEEIRMFKTISDSAVYGQGIADLEGNLLYVNSFFAEIHGYTPEELSGRHFSVFHTPAQMETGKRLIASMTREGYFGPVEVWHLHRNGTEFPMLMTGVLIRDESGSSGCIAASAIDMTAFHRAERDYRTLFREMLNGFALHEIILDQSGEPADYRFLEVNPAFERMTGLKAGDIAGRTVLEVLPGTERYWIETYGRVAITGEPAFFEHSSAELGKHFEVTAFRPAPGRFACIFQDVTERRRAEETLRETLANARFLQQEAEAANRAKSAFLANMSHEIRTPLNGVIGFLSLLADTRIDDEQREYIDYIDTSAHLLLNILSNVLDISKIEAERFDLEPVSSDLRETVERSLAPLRLSATEKGIALSTSVDRNVPELATFDPVRLEQILVNLTSNAVKFTERGSVELSLRFAPLSGNTGAFTFSVKDTGIGIPPEVGDRIFEPFYQIDDSNTRRYGGTGLGLAISQRLLRKMGSTLEVESAPGHGSRFFFTLRLACGSTGTTEDVPSTITRGSTRTPQERMKENPIIMIVEDERLNLKMLSVLISKLAPSAAVVRAENGEQAVNLFREQKPDLVFMDLQMPAKDGFQASAEIRAIETEEGPERERCCIVALTADVLPETRGACLAGGMDDYLTKPVRREDVKAVLERCLGTEEYDEKASGSALG